MAVTPQIIPLAAVNSQVLQVTLTSQSCKIKVYTKHIQVPVTDGIVTNPPVFDAINPLFLDLYVNDALILGGALCLNDTKIVRDSYLGFVGELSFTDTYGLGADPLVSGLGSRWLLLYWPPS